MELVVVAHTGFVVVWFLALVLWRDRWWPFILLDFAVVEPLIVAAVVWVVAVACRRKRLLAIASVPPLIFAALYWPYAVPDLGAGPDPAARPDVRIMTFNILNENDDLPAVLAVIDRYAPDVVAIQELTAARAPDFRSALVDTHPYSIVGSPVRGGTTALFSRTPMTTTELDFGIDRPAVLGTTTIDGHELLVVSAHLNPAYYARTEPSWLARPAAFDRYARDQQRQAELLVEALGDHRDRVVFVGCDCNTRELNETNQILSRALTDPIRELGFPLRRSSLPGTVNERRLAHIDYVWYRSPTDVAVTADGVYRVSDRAGSDHHPIIADFTLVSEP